MGIKELISVQILQICILKSLNIHISPHLAISGTLTIFPGLDLEVKVRENDLRLIKVRKAANQMVSELPEGHEEWNLGGVIGCCDDASSF